MVSLHPIQCLCAAADFHPTSLSLGKRPYRNPSVASIDYANRFFMDITILKYGLTMMRHAQALCQSRMRHGIQ
jgi:hypothetical protein